ncbi:hypothetical protein CRUP_004246, partial [Coryphaenoides rupestris]
GRGQGSQTEERKKNGVCPETAWPGSRVTGHEPRLLFPTADTGGGGGGRHRTQKNIGRAALAGPALTIVAVRQRLVLLRQQWLALPHPLLLLLRRGASGGRQEAPAAAAGWRRRRWRRVACAWKRTTRDGDLQPAGRHQLRQHQRQEPLVQRPSQQPGPGGHHPQGTDERARIRDGHRLFPRRQAPGQVGPRYDLHLLRGDV